MPDTVLSSQVKGPPTFPDDDHKTVPLAVGFVM
jgi:hypothetical protein